MAMVTGTAGGPLAAAAARALSRLIWLMTI
jgi:hypothetical protein